MNESAEYFERSSKKTEYLEGHDMTSRPLPDVMEPKLHIPSGYYPIPAGHIALKGDFPSDMPEQPQSQE